MSKYVNHNGDLVLSNEPVLSVENRAFSYGDGIFETIRCLNSKPLHFDQHYLRIKHSLDILQIDLPLNYSLSFFENEIYRLLQRNRFYKGARVRLSLYRAAGGLYTPQNNSPEFIISASELENETFTLEKKKYSIGVYTEIYKPQNILSRLKTCNALLFVKAGIWKKENNFDDCFICNEEGLIIEALSSNIFLVKDNQLFTPNLKSGCVAGTMRNVILEQAELMNIKVFFTNGFRTNDLLDADEIFLTNAIQGISSVSAFMQRRYFHSLASGLLKQLNSNIKINS